MYQKTRIFCQIQKIWPDRIFNPEKEDMSGKNRTYGNPTLEDIMPAGNEQNWAAYTVYKHYSTLLMYEPQLAGALHKLNKVASLLEVPVI